MKLYKTNIRTFGSFYSPIKGDMLFGMFCRTIADNSRDDRLSQYLKGYTSNSPFVVFSDAFPSGYLPKPTLPFTYYAYAKNDDEDEKSVKQRKENKLKKWIAVDKITLLSSEMTAFFEKKDDYISKKLKTSVHLDPQTHHTTGGKYSAYTEKQFIYSCELTIYVLLDEERIAPTEVQKFIVIMGKSGYGKKASSGYGKFELVSPLQQIELSTKSSDSYLTLAPCVPQLDTFDKDKSFYHIFVRFGRHGNTLAQSANPFKKPVMTADTGAVFTLKSTQNGHEPLKFIGTGVTDISQIEPEAVFQGYAPVIPLQLKETENGGK